MRPGDVPVAVSGSGRQLAALAALAALAGACQTLLGIEDPILLPDGAILVGPKLSSLEVTYDTPFGSAFSAELSPTFSPTFGRYDVALPLSTSAPRVFASAEPGAQVSFDALPAGDTANLVADLGFAPLEVGATVAGDDGSNTYALTLQRALTRQFSGDGAMPADASGISVAMSGPYLAIGLPRESRVRIFRRARSAWIEEANATCIGNPGEDFGYAVAMRNNYLLVGVPGRAPSGDAVLCGRNSGTWGAFTTVSGSVSQGRGGHAVALGDAFFVIGSPGPGGSLGRAESFAYDGTPLGVIDGGSFDSRLGASLALEGNDTLIVGQPGVDRVRVYEVLDGVPQTYRFIFGDVVGSAFGTSIGVSGAHLLVSAPNDPEGGRVYAYQLVPDADAIPMSFPSEAPIPGSGYGRAVAIHGIVAAVSAPGTQMIHVFVDPAGKGEWQPHLVLQEPLSADFGAALAVDAFRLAVGDPTGGDSLVPLYHVYE